MHITNYHLLICKNHLPYYPTIVQPKAVIINLFAAVNPAAPVAPAQDTTAMAEMFAAQKEELEKKIAELENKVKQGFAQVAELVEALSNTPMSEPTQKSANAFQSYISTNDIKYERLEKYRNAILNK